jgi:16S rRNA (cytosine1402-N4)-methyltransferase
VKQAFAARARSTAPVELPVVPAGTGPTLRLLTRGAEPPSAEEVAANPRAASVKLRAAQRVDPDAPQPPPRLHTGAARATRRGGVDIGQTTTQTTQDSGQPRTGRGAVDPTTIKGDG